MTIDEAIAHAREVAEWNKKKVERDCVTGRKELHPFCDLIKEAEEHEQLAEWLEDYKRVKKWKDEIMEEFCRYDASSIEELMQRARNKAIDDYVERLKETFKPCKDADNYIYTNVCRRFDEIAQQLKAGDTDAR